MNENKQLQWKRIILGTVIGFAVVYTTSKLVVNKKINHIETTLEEKVTEEQKTAKKIAELVNRNGADETVESLIKPCSSVDSIKYEELLSSLNENLPHNSLVELKRLFNNCGHKDVEKRYLTTFQLKLSIDKLSYLNDVSLKTLNKESVKEMATWQSLLTKEQEINKNFTKLVEIQQEIIEALLLGEKEDSKIVEGLRLRAGEVRNEMYSTTKETSELQNQLFKK